MCVCVCVCVCVFSYVYIYTDICIYVYELNCGLQNKFLNLLPMPLSSCTPNSKFFTKMLHSHQIITRFGSYKILTPSFNH